jgi:hypothetical protein
MSIIYQAVTNLASALDGCLEIHSSLNPKLLFLTELRKFFEDFYNNFLAFPASEDESFPFPSVVESKLTVFVNCLFVLSQHIDFDVNYICATVMSAIRAQCYEKFLCVACLHSGI